MRLQNIYVNVNETTTDYGINKNYYFYSFSSKLIRSVSTINRVRSLKHRHKIKNNVKKITRFALIGVHQ